VTAEPAGERAAGRLVLSTHADREGNVVTGPVRLLGDEAVVVDLGR
jgi:hypothetical protein